MAPDRLHVRTAIRPHINGSNPYPEGDEDSLLQRVAESRGLDKGSDLVSADIPMDAHCDEVSARFDNRGCYHPCSGCYLPICRTGLP